MSNNPLEGCRGLNKLMSEHLEEGPVFRKCCIFGVIIMFVGIIIVGLECLENAARTSQGVGRNKGRVCPAHQAPSQVGAWPRE